MHFIFDPEIRLTIFYYTEDDTIKRDTIDEGKAICFLEREWCFQF